MVLVPPVPLPLLQRRRPLGRRPVHYLAKARQGPLSLRRQAAGASLARNHPPLPHHPHPASSGVRSPRRPANLRQPHLPREVACLVRSPPRPRLLRVPRLLRLLHRHLVGCSATPAHRPRRLLQRRLRRPAAACLGRLPVLQQLLQRRRRRPRLRPSQLGHFSAVPQRPRHHNLRQQVQVLPPPQPRHQRRVRQLPRPLGLASSAPSLPVVQPPLRRAPRNKAEQLPLMVVPVRSVLRPLARHPGFPR